jgi:threonine aldolase
MAKSFASDNNSTIHHEILKAITDANKEHYVAYGEDKFTKEAQKVFKETFGEETETFFVLTGTGANVTALQNYCQRFHAVICTNWSHINVDECGAPEHAMGIKLLTVETMDGKLKPQHIDKFMHHKGDQHHVQPRVVSLSQPTELGTVYTIEELKEVIDSAHKHGLIVHMDGARLSNAAEALGHSLKEITADVGVDVLCFGGTKNGLMLGEAVVFFNKEHINNYPFIRKQNMQLVSKMRFVTAQFIPYLRDKIWLENAEKANTMARYLYHKIIIKHPEIIAFRPQTNAIFIKLPQEIATKMQEKSYFYTWDEENGIYRFMTSFDMTQDDVNDFANFVLASLR